jgi:hypothetical protein
MEDYPTLSDYTEEELERMRASFRKLRNEELARTDHMVLPDMNPPQELLDYRQALRDVTEYPGWPIEWPDLVRWTG